MENNTYTWLEKIENNLTDFKEKYIERAAEMSTKLDTVIHNYNSMEERIQLIESWKNNKDGEDKAKEANLRKWGIAIIAIEVLLAGVAILISVKLTDN